MDTDDYTQQIPSITTNQAKLEIKKKKQSYTHHSQASAVSQPAQTTEKEMLKKNWKEKKNF